MSDVVLRDGSTVRVRAVMPNDESSLRVFLGDLSRRSRLLRYFAGVGDELLRREATRQAHVDDARAAGLVVTTGETGRIVAHAEYGLVAPGRAEVGFTVADSHHGMGLATILLGQL